MNLKTITSTLVFSLPAIAAVFLFTGCAETEQANTKSLLSAAGFHTVTPSTPLQKEVWAKLPSYQTVKVSTNGKTIYAYKDEEAGVAYVGHHPEYQRYVNLCVQQHVAQQYYMASSWDPYWSGRWYGAWGYRRGYW